jgi:hypothetical protein
MAAAPGTGGTDDPGVVNSLKFLRQQLKFGEATPAIQALIHEMLTKAKVYAEEAPEPADAPSPDKKDKKEKDKKKKDKGGSKAGEYEAECLSCLEERVGKFYRRGFKCNWCAGTDEGTHARPVSSEPAYVPSAAMARGFVKLSTDSDAAMALQPPPEGDDNDDNDETRGELDDDEGGSGVPSPDTAVGNPSIVIDASQSRRSGGSPMRRKGDAPVESDVEAGDHELPQVRYGLSVFKYATEEAGAGNKSSRAAGCVRPGDVAERRKAYHPTLLYGYTMTRDDDAEELTVVTESARLLKVRGAVLGRCAAPNFELIMQVALAALHAMQYLKATFKSPHGDLRPYNFFVDALHNVKLRHAPFVTDAPLPAPFCAPEDDLDHGSERPVHSDAAMIPFARDMYALGITLTVIAYGEPSLPSIGDITGGAEETALVRFIEPMIRDDPNERCTISEALASRFHSTIRVVNGVPMESIYCRIDVKSAAPQPQQGLPDRQASTSDVTHDADPTASGSTTAGPPSPGSHLAQPPIVDVRASPMSMSSARGSFRFGSANIMRVPEEPDLVFAEGVEAAVTPANKKGQEMLSEFLRNGGPMFQVVRTHGHVTIYSVRKDPRRKPNVSFLGASGNGGRGDSQSDFGVSASSSFAPRRGSLS